MIEYALIQDDSGHWYACPADAVAEVEASIEAVERYWDAADYDAPTPSMDPRAVRIDGPHDERLVITLRP